jgi:hypothetical protein
MSSAGVNVFQTVGIEQNIPQERSISLPVAVVRRPGCSGDINAVQLRQAILMPGAARTYFFSEPVSVFKRSLLILSTTPALRSATSLILYSAALPNNSAVSAGVSL